MLSPASRLIVDGRDFDSCEILREGAVCLFDKQTLDLPPRYVE